MPKTVYVAGTCDTKGNELNFVAAIVRSRDVSATIVDLSTSAGWKSRPAVVSRDEVASYHPDGVDAVLTGDRGSAVAAMGVAFERYLQSRGDLAGVIGLGGGGGTSMVTAGMRGLPIGVPRVMVSTLAGGDVGQYVGPNDIMMVNAITDIAGLNRISRAVLSNAANAIAGMAAHPVADELDARPSIGLTMFGVTTPAVTEITARLRERFECLVFHATGNGGQTMEKLADSGHLAGVLDITTTEVADLLVGGVLPATQDRFGFLGRRQIPYVGSCGALDMVNFWARETVPEKFRSRNLYQHNPQVTLMRTTADENVSMGRWIGERLNRSVGEVVFILPEGGVSLLDRPGMAFYDPEADEALFKAIEDTVITAPHRRVVRTELAINDPKFAELATGYFLELVERTKK